MLSKEEKRQFRGDLFRHLDGVVVAPTAFTLQEKGVLEFLLQQDKVNLSTLTQRFKANEGYLNVALRVLAAQGWLDYYLDKEQDQIVVAQNKQSAIAFEYVGLYEDVVRLMQFSGKFHRRKFALEPFKVLDKIYQKYYDNCGIQPSEDAITHRIQQQILKHIEGVLVGPTAVLMGMGGMFHKYFMEASFRPDEYHKDPESFGKILDFFTFLGWFKKKNETYRFTEKGLFFAKRASAYGVTVSYSPTLRKLDELIFGNPNILRDVPATSPELHVDREMNVWGSGGAHAAYFKKIDEIIIDIFNQPIEDQPKGILDMGCGNGAFLIHLFDVIEHRTRRGEMLEEYPLFLVGIDYNQTALKVTRANLIQADIWAKVIWGDIGKPAQLEADLQEDYDIELKDLLNVRTFLDHNRIWEDPADKSMDKPSTSTGAFAHRGQRISNHLVERNLKQHLQKWMPYVSRFGLLVIELHTISPELTASNLGKTAATAYDATHGYSDQYILEVEVFNRIANEVGLYNDPKYFSKFPDSDLATVSINFLKGT